MKRGALPSSNPKKFPRPTLEQLDPKIREMYEFETVSKIASSTLPKPWNSGYLIVRFQVPADPPIILHSRHQVNSMIPWGVIVGEKRWKTYSPQLPKLLEQFGKNGWLKTAGRNVERGFAVQRGPEWFDNFFFNYHENQKNKMQTIRDIEIARKIKGWNNVARFVTIEDALVYSDGAICIQAKMKDVNCTVDRFQWTATKQDSRRDKPSLHDWSDFMRASKEFESSVTKAGWLKNWRLKYQSRSLVGMLTTDGNCTYTISDETNNFWNRVGLPNKTEFYCKAFRGKTHTGDVFLGDPYKISLATDLGSGLNETRKDEEEVSKASPSLRAYDNGRAPLEKRMWCLIDQSGARIATSLPPKNYALPAGFKYPTAKEIEYDFSWPVDREKEEDIEYLDTQFDDEPIQTMNFPFESTLVGEVDEAGKIILKPEFKWLGAFSCGLAPFSLPGGKRGYADESGKVVIAAQFDKAHIFYDGLAAVKKNAKWGFIDVSGKFQIPLIFDSVHRFSEGLAPAKIGAKFGYIDKTGQYAIKPQFARARHFINGLAHVLHDEKQAYIDHSGKPIGGHWHDSLNRFSDERSIFKRGEKYGYIDRTGNEIIPARFSKAYDFRDGIANVEIGSIASAIDKFGKPVPVPPSHSDFWDGPITEKLIRASVDSHLGRRFGFKNYSNQFVIKPIYDNVGVFNEGMCPAKVNSKWGVIDKAGKFVVMPTFDETGQKFSEQKLAVKSNGKWGVINSSGVEIVKPKYDRIFSFANGMAVVQSDLLFGYINSTGVEVVHPQFDSAHSFGTTGRARIGRRVEPFSLTDLP